LLGKVGPLTSDDRFDNLRYVSREEIALLQSTWAKKSAFSNAVRLFVELSGRVQPS
jgi:hypothetical protein